MLIENKLNGKSFDIVEDNIEKLKGLFPEIVTGDNEVDIAALIDIFGNNGDETVEDSEEYYKFTWWGKKGAKKEAKETTTKTLRPVKKDSKKWDTTQNIYIEGDNLYALKIILGSYRNRIKMIYIDPPYNTGNEFIYNDKFAETTQEHLENTGQLSDEGFLYENAKFYGKTHSQWLSDMYSRLYLARKLLTDDGVIFISIDDNELSNIKKVCDEIFGENNFLAEISRIANAGSKNDSNLFIKDNDYILVYSKNVKNVKINRIKRKNTQVYPKKDHIGEFKLRALEMQGGGEDTLEDRPNMGYSIYYNPETSDYKLLHDYDLNNPEVYEKPSIDLINKGYVCIRPKKGQNNSVFGRWRWSKEKFLENLSEIFIDIENKRAFTKDRKKEFIESSPSCNIKFLNAEGTKEISDLFDLKLFSFPKPTSLLDYLISIGSNNDSIILDFFSGSATTAHSVMKLNSNPESNRKFIMIQIQEPTFEIKNGKKIPLKNSKIAFNAGYEYISEIGKERIRRAGDKILEESEIEDLDIGFKVFKIDESNFIPWNPEFDPENQEDKMEKTKQAILATANNLVPGRSELDLVYELLLKLNMDLNCPIDETNVNGRKVYVVDNGYLLICLENNLDASIADDLLKLKNNLMVEYCEVVLKDKALDDNTSINIYETLNSNNVEFYTI